METCLHCSFATIEKLSNIVDYWIVDVKSLIPIVYENYTGVRSRVEQHLLSLKKLVPQEIVTAKIPHILGYNDNQNVEEDLKYVKRMFEFDDIRKIEYRVK